MAAAAAADVAAGMALEQVRRPLAAVAAATLAASPQLQLESLARALRKSREDVLKRQRRRLVDSLSARSSASSVPSSKRQGRGAPCRCSPSLSGMQSARSGAAPLPARVVHRHHHHHYHHHYVVGPGNEAGLPASLREAMEEPAEASDARGRGTGVSQQPRGGRLDATGTGGRGPDAVGAAVEVEHLHYHHHTGEEAVPPRAHRLLADARKASQGATRGGVAGPDTRLPRLL